MLYLKHAELVEKYHVSLKTVHNWIDSAKQGKLELDLVEKVGRTFISNSPANVTLIEQLVEQGKKYRNAKYHKVAEPTPEFYRLYSRQQILDIVTNLDTHREIPRQYNYFDGGASNWDRYAERMYEQESANLLKSSIALLHANQGAIDLLIENKKRVNVIDIGPGNALPVKNLLKHLLNKGVLHRYIAVDISKEMLQIAERNIKRWFGNSIKFEGYVRDISHERFNDVLVDDMLDKGSEETINLALLLGATPMNFRAPYDILKAICGSLSHDDLLVYTDKPDSELERRYFDFNPIPGSSTLSPNHRFIFDLLNIDESLYEVEMGFNDESRVRYIRVRFKMSVTIKFSFDKGERNINIEKGDTILLWRVWHLNTLEIISSFEEAGFTLLQSSLTKDRQYLMTISGIDTAPEIAS